MAFKKITVSLSPRRFRRLVACTRLHKEMAMEELKDLCQYPLQNQSAIKKLHSEMRAHDKLIEELEKAMEV